jgi:hypothetical protein
LYISWPPPGPSNITKPSESIIKEAAPPPRRVGLENVAITPPDDDVTRDVPLPLADVKSKTTVAAFAQPASDPNVIRVAARVATFVCFSFIKKVLFVIFVEQHLFALPQITD